MVLGRRSIERDTNVRYARRGESACGLFDGKVAIVTGAGRGIGRAEALLLAAEGAAVVVNDLGGAADRRGRRRSDRPSRSSTRSPRPAATAVANYDDIASWAGAEALVAQAVDDVRRARRLINNAGILRDKMSFNMDRGRVGLGHRRPPQGPLRAEPLRRRPTGGSRSRRPASPVDAAIVNTASESGLYGNAGQVNYAAAKAGIASMTIVMARELERIGVRVNAIAPVARTRLTEAVAGDFMKPKEGEFDRFAPENVAAVAVLARVGPRARASPARW